jgi:putative intracellular protease/amidase
MGEGTPHVAGRDGASARVVALGAEVTAARDRLGALVAELGRRRDEVMDWRTQIRRHRRVLTFVLGGAVALAAAGLALPIARGRRQAGLAARVAELTDKADRLQHALGRVVEDPDRLAPAAPPARKREAIWAALSLVLPVVRILLPHIAAALAPPPRRR